MEEKEENNLLSGCLNEKEKDEKKEEYIIDVVKTPEWDKVIPTIIEAIDQKKNNNSNYLEYPYFRIQNAVQYLPKLDSTSEILNSNQLKELHSRLPSYHQYTSLFKIFSISIDGSALKSFYNKCEEINNSVLVIKDDDDNIFGAYASEVYTPTSKFSGTGELLFIREIKFIYILPVGLMIIICIVMMSKYALDAVMIIFHLL